ncbi:hypothetical protein [Spiroplasma poulsonii]|uniref:Uncharacterized protein n=1 Tax=Spiroplasma poulsonii TaxID=2138 RepID=A0A2P6FER8_9MOLU|nr:hypothetical protein [Spiroplasma poulsonii]KAF0850309.1 16S rRNA (uracil1498-N3)-methyltransferase [Spiroplasma poulsonii]PQM31956.1 hypothetical protein SMSRO_SF018240 [Spiroplasma poulsonii]PWF94425.1 hypothetical protein SMH99_24090 [Spiroplasma poulsonii]PWF96994.1 hypothetical protein SMSE_24410 [Spiroplasma poulsonii]
MHRFFAITLEHNYFVLTADDVKQIKQVLRLKDNRLLAIPFFIKILL